ncbi:MAG: pyrroloquinoline quinone-dependent dehydrogenase, partial [Acetobacteraceae bacterium]
AAAPEQAAAPSAQAPAGPRGVSAPVSVNMQITEQQLLGANQNPGNWMLYGRTYDNQRFSPLSQVNANNVGSMTPMAIIQTGVVGSYEVSPIVDNGIMFITTPWDHVIAYNAATGKELWSYKAKLGYNTLCCGPESRGVAVANGKVYVATLDAHLIALSAYTGKPEWNTQVADSRDAYSITMAPQIYDGMVLVGTSGAEFPVRDFVAAYDAHTGKLVWKFYTTAASGQPGGDTWSGDSAQTGGGSMWNTPAIDPARGLAIFAVGNPNPDNDGANRMGANAYTDSIVAVHIKTGKLAWWYQQVPHDVWDYDAMAPVVLLNVKNDQGQEVPAAAEGGKEGQVFFVNRDNGHLIRKSEPFVMQSSTMWTKPPQGSDVNIYPGAQGGNEWSPEAYSPKTGLFYIQGTNESWEYTASNDATVKGHLRLGGVLQPITPEGPIVMGEPDAAQQKESTAGAIDPSGTLTAINVDNGKIAWQYHSNYPMLGGVMTTGGNLVFAGEFNGDFDAFNATTGQKVWHFNMGAGVTASPVTYMVNGRQYVAVAAGGNAANGNVVLMKKLGINYGDEIGIFAVSPHALMTN